MPVGRKVAVLLGLQGLLPGSPHLLLLLAPELGPWLLAVVLGLRPCRKMCAPG